MIVAAPDFGRGRNRTRLTGRLTPYLDGRADALPFGDLWPSGHPQLVSAAFRALNGIRPHHESLVINPGRRGFDFPCYYSVGERVLQCGRTSLLHICSVYVLVFEVSDRSFEPERG